MAKETRCQTPGATYHTKITTSNAMRSQVDIYIDMLGEPLRGLDEQELETLQNNIHNALELVFAPYYRE